MMKYMVATINLPIDIMDEIKQQCSSHGNPWRSPAVGFLRSPTADLTEDQAGRHGEISTVGRKEKSILSLKCHF